MIVRYENYLLLWSGILENRFASEPITASLTGPRALQTRATFLSIFDKRQSYLQFIHNVYFFIIPLPAPNMLDL